MSPDPPFQAWDHQRKSSTFTGSAAKKALNPLGFDGFFFMTSSDHSKVLSSDRSSRPIFFLMISNCTVNSCAALMQSACVSGSPSL
jgi:hypothetical protein